jgi:hypothetical protein
MSAAKGIVDVGRFRRDVRFNPKRTQEGAVFDFCLPLFRFPRSGLTWPVGRDQSFGLPACLGCQPLAGTERWSGAAFVLPAGAPGAFSLPLSWRAAHSCRKKIPQKI